MSSGRSKDSLSSAVNFQMVQPGTPPITMSRSRAACYRIACQLDRKEGRDRIFRGASPHPQRALHTVRLNDILPHRTLPGRPVRMSGPALREGVEEQVIEKVPVKIFGPAKIVADGFSSETRSD
jgi:hypothetical protein